MEVRASARWYGAGVGFLVLLADQLTKGFVRTAAEGAVLFSSRWVDILHVQNRGISFGLFNGGRPWQVFAIGAVAGAIGLVVFLQYWRARGRWLAACYGLVLGGALGNLIDRGRYGAVTDFIDFHIAHLRVPFFGWQVSNWHWPAFNVADCAIVVGCALLVLCLSHTPGGHHRRTQR